jgi:2-iminobutanoate/2-iminopropanoate deaminase
MRARKRSSQRSLLILSLLAGIAAATPTATAADTKRHIILPGRTDTLPYSDGVLVGDTLYLAGRIGIDPGTGKPPDDVEKEIRFLLEGVKATLKEANMTMDDLVFVQVFCPDLSLYDKFNEIYRTYFTKDFPARAFIGSGPLLRGGHFEMQGIAVRR